MFRISGMLAAALIAAGCGEVFVTLPAQRPARSHEVRELLDMTGGRPENAWGAVVSGVHNVSDPHADWRWAAGHSVFRFTLEEFAGWSLSVKLTAAKAVLDKTGPQRVSFLVNGRPAGSVALDASRTYDLSFPVDAAVLQSAQPITVAMDAGPCLDQDYGPPFCVLLHTIGFVQEPR